MAMALIIDAYNVTRSDLPAALGELSVARLCVLLSTSTWARRGRVVVVCDGAPTALGLLESPVGGVVLSYAGHGRKADDLIEKLVSAERSPSQCVVVTSDRKLRHRVKDAGGKTIKSAELVTELLEQHRHQQQRQQQRKESPDACDNASPAPAPRRLSEDQTRRWMREFGVE
jgi:predicted RNA-binding protein with PIN domain